jgi:hypothetical protein
MYSFVRFFFALLGFEKIPAPFNARTTSEKPKELMPSNVIPLGIIPQSRFDHRMNWINDMLDRVQDRIKNRRCDSDKQYFSFVYDEEEWRVRFFMTDDFTVDFRNERSALGSTLEEKDWSTCWRIIYSRLHCFDGRQRDGCDSSIHVLSDPGHMATQETACRQDQINGVLCLERHPISMEGKTSCPFRRRSRNHLRIVR